LRILRVKCVDEANTINWEAKDFNRLLKLLLNDARRPFKFDASALNSFGVCQQNRIGAILALERI